MKLIIKTIYLIKYYLHNKKYFQRNITNSNNIVLLERYNYFPSLVAFSYFLNLLSKKYNAKIYSYNPRISSFSKQIRFVLNPKNLIMKFLYKSFNVSKNITPIISTTQKRISDQLFKKIYSKIKKKEDILKVKILNIHIGDLIYDEYLRFYKEPTINPENKKFQEHLNNMISLFLFWNDYFIENKVKSIVISHSVYAIAIISRIAIYKKIKTYNIGVCYAYCLDKKNNLRLSGFDKYKTDFKLISKLTKKNLINYGKKELHNYLYGEKKFLISNYMYSTPFKKINIISNKKLKEKILVASHCLTDAVHAYGSFQFPDFYCWLEFLGKLSKKLDYEWIIKIHPNQYDLNLNEMKKFVLKFPKFELLKKEMSHNEILNSYNILSVLTVYGSIGHEYPLFGVPVINASTNNPHATYNFNININSKKELKKIIFNIKKIKKPVAKKLKDEIYEFYYMRHLSEYYCINNHDKIIVKLGNNYNSSLFYKNWIEKFNIKHHNKVLRDYDNFIQSNKFRMLADNTKNRSIYLKIF